MKRIAITMGEPGGVGPELVIRALEYGEIHTTCHPVVIGDRDVIYEALSVHKPDMRPLVVSTPEEADGAGSGVLPLIDMRISGGYRKAAPSAEGGRASYAFIEKAVELAANRKVDAVVTAPISKEALRMAGFPWPGHTEMLAELTRTKDYAMVFLTGRLKVLLVTTHTALGDVPALITKDSVLGKIRLSARAGVMLGIRKPRIGVAGLNPHAGEGGIMGTEDAEHIAPAVREAREEGIEASGPHPPDVIFHRAWQGGQGGFDIVVAMYHDQGLIPLKMTAFEECVNVTVGLPFVRTSPGHGTAYDIAWKGVANPRSMLEAIKAAVRLKAI